MRKYEVFTVIPGTLTEEEVQPVVSRVVEVIQETGASNVDPKPLGKMRISYPIKHVRYGYFFNFIFDAAPEIIKSLNNKLQIEENLLRAIIRTFDPAQREKKNSRRVPNQEVEAKKEEIVKKTEEVLTTTPPPPTPEQTRPKAEAVDMAELDKELDKLLEQDITIDV
jgi:small subunit ribosomal protein S6